LGYEAVLELYQVDAVTRSTVAQAEVSVRLGRRKAVTARGTDPDTLVASARVYCRLNKLMVKRGRHRPEIMAG
jgi:2-isopropylmalate synthase